ncbi:MAG: propanoyl-CoA acyltransferase [Deltaproteobacteria bacterium]|nr:propanoyl-CoA acyltransferase [Deltaproteobacteria bacterium]
MNCTMPRTNADRKVYVSMSKVSIIGAYNTQFGSFARKNPETGEIEDTKSFYELLNEAGRGAVADSCLGYEDIDAIWIGSCSPTKFINQEHAGPLGLEVAPEIFRFLPTYRVEGACASSSVALYNAIYGIESGRFKRVLVIGVEKMNLLDTAGVTHTLACCSHWPSEGAHGMTFPGLFAEYAKGYRSHYRLRDDDLRRMLATVSALAYRNGVQNPLAHFGKGSPPDRMGLFSAEAVMALPSEGKSSNPMIAPPLRLHDCSLVTDGAAALVLSLTEDARAISKRVVEIAGVGAATERLAEKDRPNMYELMAGKVAVSKSFAEAGISIGDVDFAEVHDCFTINELLSVEALGLSKDGNGGWDFIEGRFTPVDSCPINLSGGLKAKGHPVGATGASMHALAYKQLVEEPIGVAPGRGAPGIGVVFNVGGSAATNCVTTLRRI